MPYYVAIYEDSSSDEGRRTTVLKARDIQHAMNIAAGFYRKVYGHLYDPDKLTGTNCVVRGGVIYSSVNESELQKKPKRKLEAVDIVSRMYRIVQDGKEVGLYHRFNATKGEDATFCLVAPSDLGVGPFYTNQKSPQTAVCEVRRYLREQWGRDTAEVKVYEV